MQDPLRALALTAVFATAAGSAAAQAPATPRAVVTTDPELNDSNSLPRKGDGTGTRSLPDRPRGDRTPAVTGRP